MSLDPGYQVIHKLLGIIMRSQMDEKGNLIVYLQVTRGIMKKLEAVIYELTSP